MPVEIREILIQAKVPDKSAADGANQQSMPVQLVQGEDSNLAANETGYSAELVQKVVDICMKEMKAWLTEKSIR